MSPEMGCPVVLHTRVVTGRGGGPDKTILNSPRFLKDWGYEAACAYMHPPADTGFAAIQAKAAAANARLLSVPDRGAWDWMVVKQLIRICRRLKVAIWHGHEYKSNALGLLIRRAWPMKLITTVHGWGVQDTSRMPLYYRVDRFCLRHYDEVICVSKDLWSECSRLGIRAQKCHLIENAIDTGDFSRTGVTDDVRPSLVLGAMGRLSEEKGFDILIKAVDMLVRRGVRCELRIAGDGSQRAVLETLIDRLGCASHVTLLGHVEDTKTFYEQLDAYVLSSLREGLPNVLLEAMSMEVPVVATRVAGVPQLIADGQNGLLVQPGSVEQLAEGIDRLLGDAGARRRLAHAARDTIVRSHGFDRRMGQVVEIYDRSLNRRPAGGTVNDSR